MDDSYVAFCADIDIDDLTRSRSCFVKLEPLDLNKLKDNSQNNMILAGVDAFEDSSDLVMRSIGSSSARVELIPMGSEEIRNVENEASNSLDAVVVKEENIDEDEGSITEFHQHRPSILTQSDRGRAWTTEGSSCRELLGARVKYEVMEDLEPVDTNAKHRKARKAASGREKSIRKTGPKTRSPRYSAKVGEGVPLDGKNTSKSSNDQHNSIPKSTSSLNKEHSANHGPYKCAECGKSYAKLIHLVRHQVNHMPEQRFICPQCPDTFNRKCSLHKHIIMVHNQPVGKTQHICQEKNCNKLCRDAWDLKLHRAKAHGYKLPYKCSSCDKSFLKQSYLDKHVSCHHSSHVCEHCGRSFANIRILNHHKITHVSKHNLFKCTYNGCNESFKLRPKLLLHMSVVHEVKRFKCDICEKTFHRKYQVADHIRCHTGEKPFTCEQCGRNFRRRDHLNIHKCGGARGRIEVMNDVNCNATNLIWYM